MSAKVEELVKELNGLSEKELALALLQLNLLSQVGMDGKDSAEHFVPTLFWIPDSIMTRADEDSPEVTNEVRFDKWGRRLSAACFVHSELAVAMVRDVAYAISSGVDGEAISFKVILHDSPEGEAITLLERDPDGEAVYCLAFGDSEKIVSLPEGYTVVRKKEDE